jgi:hypothetical protein
VIRAWKTIFVGTSRRTDEAGAEGLPFSALWLQRRPVKVRGALHLKSACSTSAATCRCSTARW